MSRVHTSRSVLRKATPTVLLATILTAFGAHVDVIHDNVGAIRQPFNLATEYANPFPECADSASAAEDCPMKKTVRGFPVHVSSYLPDELTDTVLKWLDLADAVLLELETSHDIRRYFIERLRQSGVSFYLGHDDRDGTLGVTDPYLLCRAGGFYVSGTRVIQEGLSPAHPQNTNWNSVRHLLIHELSHAFHDIALVDGFDNQCVRDACRFSVQRDGLRYKTYASSNHLEYFAQMVS